MALSCNPNDLAAAAKCFKCLPGATLAEVQTYLLCQILNNGGTGGGGGGVPALPDGQIFVGNSLNVATAVPMTGDATMADTGALTLANTAQARTDIGLGTTNAPQFSGLGIGVAAVSTSGVFISYNHAQIVNTFALNIQTTNGGGMGDETAVVINTAFASGSGGTASLSIQQAGAQSFAVAWNGNVTTNGTVTALNYTEKVVVAGTTGAVALNIATGGIFTSAQSGDITFTFSGAVAGQTFKVIVTGDASHQVTWPTVKWTGGVAPKQTLNKIDVYTFLYDGTNFYGSAVQNMS